MTADKDDRVSYTRRQQIRLEVQAAPARQADVEDKAIRLIGVSAVLIVPDGLKGRDAKPDGPQQRRYRTPYTFVVLDQDDVRRRPLNRRGFSCACCSSSMSSLISI
jgi:hypothetical protein